MVINNYCISIWTIILWYILFLITSFLFNTVLMHQHIEFLSIMHISPINYVILLFSSVLYCGAIQPYNFSVIHLCIHG